jgi:hypothetical protein
MLFTRDSKSTHIASPSLREIQYVKFLSKFNLLRSVSLSFFEFSLSLPEPAVTTGGLMV